MPRASAENTNALLRDVTRLFLQAQRSLSACCSDASAKECEALMLLGRAAPLTVQDFAEKMGLEKTWASRLVARLAKRGVVRRTDHPDDGRSWLLELTPKGRREHAALDAAVARHATSLLCCVPAAERANVERTLGHLRDALARCLTEGARPGRRVC